MQSASRRPLTFHGRLKWLYHGEKVVHDAIGHRLVKNPFIPEPLQVHFETFQLNTHLIGDVGENNFSVVRLSRLWTNGSKFWAVVHNRKTSRRTGIIEDLQHVSE